MPPKATPEAGNTSNNAETTAIRALCYLLMSCEETKADHGKLAPLLGLEVGRNVPRKIHNIVSKYGFEYRGNRIIEKNPSTNDDEEDEDDDDDDDNDTVAIPKAKATTRKAAATKTPRSRKRKAPTTTKTPASKRAKKIPEIDEADEADEMDVKEESDSDDEQDTMAGIAIISAA